MFGEVDKVKKAIDRLRTFEPPEGYYIAFSGGKDSQCIYHLAEEADVKFDAHYNITTVDPPELVKFIRENYPAVTFNRYKKSMWRLIEKNGPPTRFKRFCCKELKEKGGEGRICVTGVRWAESAKRTANRNAFEVMASTGKKDNVLFNDNDKGRRSFENCQLKGKRIVNPIIDWLDEDVWGYIKDRNIKYCSLYDEGYHRLGCIGCPQAGGEQMKEEFLRWPKYKTNYLKAFDRFLKHRESKGLDNQKYGWIDAESLMEWWLSDGERDKEIDVMEGQIDIIDYSE